MEKEEFLKTINDLKTIFMHTMTFKLGNLHLSDTKDSVERVLTALEAGKFEQGELASYEEQVYNELAAMAKDFEFSNGESLSSREVAQILRKTVAVPKIGSRIGLDSAFNQADLF